MIFEFFLAALPEAAEAAPVLAEAAPEAVALTTPEAAVGFGDVGFNLAEAGATSAMPEVAATGIGTLEGLSTAELNSLIKGPELAKDLATSTTVGGTGAGTTGINEIQTKAVDLLATSPGAGVTPAGIEQLPVAGQPSNLQFAAAPITSDVGAYSTDQAILNAVKNNPVIPQDETLLNAFKQANAPEGVANLKMPGAEPYKFGLDTVSKGPIEGYLPGSNQYTSFNPNLSYASQVTAPYSTTVLPAAEIAPNVPVNPEKLYVEGSSLEKGFKQVMDYAEKIPGKIGNYVEEKPLSAAMLGLAGANLLGAGRPRSSAMPNASYTGPLSKYRLSPNFQPSYPTPVVYRPTYPTYAEGGITTLGVGGAPQSEGAVGQMDDEPMGDDYKMAKGGIASYARGDEVALQEYLKMMEQPKYEHLPANPSIPNVGIMYDADPDTRYKDALTAAMIRMEKVNKKANYTPEQNLQRPRVQLGQINLAPPKMKPKTAGTTYRDEEMDFAAGGITQIDHYALGGYADGSVPRLLKGPGDGMSDNIPATIDGKQPARLADGEFVVPADVVSHLGNGSTDAGAKKLHKMMTDVRRDRTGNPKQGKEIVAEKYLPRKKA